MTDRSVRDSALRPRTAAAARGPGAAEPAGAVVSTGTAGTAARPAATAPEAPAEAPDKAPDKAPQAPPHTERGAGRAQLPPARGPFSETVLRLLRSAPGGDVDLPAGVPLGDPLGEDVQLALYVLYELHYRGFEGVSDAWEWDPELLRLRRDGERAFLAALRERTGGGRDVAAALDPLLVEPVQGTGPTHHLAERGTWRQMREFLVHRSVYQLKEADPHLWVVPRLQGTAKAALVAVEYDEFGAGCGERMHSRLYADLLVGAGLDSGYLRYLDRVPAPALAIVNMMSLFGLHRSLRGALVGHFAAAEITTAPSARRMVRALRRLGADEAACVPFYAEHIEADAVHEQVMRHDVIGDLLAREPELAADVVFGIEATEVLEDALADQVMGAWERGESSLLRPLD
ncbi:iron-containing redox enzyme family protein [Streptomyces sp. URMC 123]|uniref:iron-containing redox enzyme family protein n=1 Tax=Streptomyces sp. URMC 123 TaxID=3423403 RepID=UPI003F1B1CF8